MANETTVDPYAVAAGLLKQIIDAEYEAEQITAIHDQLHEALGSDRVAVGIAPSSETSRMGNRVVNVFTIEIRFYDLWDKEVDPEQTVNPTRITGYANRLKRALEQSAFSGTREVWYFNWLRTDYPNDPTGNKTRFHMHIEVFGDNTAITETIA